MASASVKSNNSVASQEASSTNGDQILKSLAVIEFYKKDIPMVLRLTTRQKLSIHEPGLAACQHLPGGRRILIIRGLPPATGVQDIFDELTRMGFPVHRISPMPNYVTEQPQPTFLCDVFRIDLLSSMYEITNLLDFQISINVYHSKQIRICLRMFVLLTSSVSSVLGTTQP